MHFFVNTTLGFYIFYVFILATNLFYVYAMYVYFLPGK